MKELIRNWLQIECDCGQPVKPVRKYKGVTKVFNKRIPVSFKEKTINELDNVNKP